MRNSITQTHMHIDATVMTEIESIYLLTTDVNAILFKY